MRRGTVFPFGVFVVLQLRVGCHQPARFLSCGSPRLRRFCPRTVEPYWLSSPSSLFSRSVLRESASRSSGLRVERFGCKHLSRSTSPAFGRHYRVLPQRLAVIPEQFGLSVSMRGKATELRALPYCAPGCWSHPRRGVAEPSSPSGASPFRTAKPGYSKRGTGAESIGTVAEASVRFGPQHLV
jgi:hypothetical protein